MLLTDHNEEVKEAVLGPTLLARLESTIRLSVLAHTMAGWLGGGGIRARACSTKPILLWVAGETFLTLFARIHCMALATAPKAHFTIKKGNNVSPGTEMT